MSEGIQESLLVFRKLPGSIHFCKDFSTLTSKSYITRPTEREFYVDCSGFGSFFLQELRRCIVKFCLEETENWCCPKERPAELTQFSGKVRGMMCSQGLHFLCSLIFFFPVLKYLERSDKWCLCL